MVDVQFLACCIADFSKGGTVPDRMYLINLGFILTLILHITSALVYQLLSMAIKRSKAGVCSDLSESLSFRSCFVYYSIFLILKMINPSTHPVHWLIISGSYNCGEYSAYLYLNVYRNVPGKRLCPHGHLPMQDITSISLYILELLHSPFEIRYMGAYPGVGACPGYYGIHSIHTYMVIMILTYLN